ncbi:hypothetical protein [Nocardia pseudobrasiliensis]|uniref:Deazaflavin-dependent oxidoreductase (Nitroreductase family) n=1 Tax=Nocardia pseudobrasiliensis TaxID=45979 RepID=A0A370IC38_9NOCA|nr:hypothetical protein [Nocardia pseudobrasiliensis]RDI68298.1 hypothetical protein DFR76_102699 [Nocardia pseudobrasiliensis]
MTTRYETPGPGATAVLTALRVTGLFRNIGELRYQGRRSGRHVALPVSYLLTDDRVVVRVARADTKTWWRNFRTPHAASIRIDGRWLTGTGRIVALGSLEHEEVQAIFRQAHPHDRRWEPDPYLVIDLGRPVRRDRVRTGSFVWWRWFSLVTVGEFLGFLAPATAGASTIDAGAGMVVAAVLLSAVVEGSTLGWFQAFALRPVLPRLPAARWTAATVGGALFAWLLGLIPMLWGERIGRWPTWIQLPLMASVALTIVFSLGIAQWIVLRRWTDRAELWIWANAVGWVLGLLAFGLVAMPLWHPGQSRTDVLLVGVLAGLVMAAVMAAITGAFLRAIVRESHLVAGLGTSVPRPDYPRL